MRTAPFFVGYGCLDGWWQMVSADVLVLTPTSDQLVKYFSALLPALVFICISGRVAPLVRRRYREVLYLFGFAATFGTFTLYLAISGAVDMRWLSAINALLGLAHVCLVISWWEKLTTLRIADMWAAFGCAIVVGTIISLVANVVPSYFQSAMFCVLPLVSTFLLQIRHRADAGLAGSGGGRADSDGVAHAAGAARDDRLGFVFVKRALPAVPLLLVIVLGLVNIPSEALVVIEHGAGRDDVGLVAISLDAIQRMLVNLAAIALAYLAVRVNIAIAFYLAVPLIALAAFFLALGYDGVGVFHAVSRIGSETVRYIVVYLLFRVVIERKVPALFCYSLMELLHCLGNLLGLCTALALAENRMVLALAFLLVLMAAMLFLLAAQQRGELVPGMAGRAARGEGDAGKKGDKGDTFCSEGAAAEPVVAEPAPLDTADALDAFAARYSLTKRECSVMELWVKGHTTAFIEERLCVSKHTVKTHVNHIYEKTGVNSKEGLILLFEQFRSSEDTPVK